MYYKIKNKASYPLTLLTRWCCVVVGKDKFAHFFVSFLIAFIGALFYGANKGAVISFVIGAIKEIVFDHYLKLGKFEWEDIIANSLGIVSAWLIFR